MTEDQKIEVAERSYIKAIGILKNLCDARRGSKKMDEEYAKIVWYFEAALQGVLLYASIKAGRITETSMNFIKNITVSGQFLNVANTVGLRKLYRKWEKLTWDNIVSNDMPQDKLLEVMQESVASCVRNFVFPIAQFDSDISNRNYGNELAAHIKKILHAVFSPDIEERAKEISDPQEKMDFKLKEMENILDSIDAGIKVFNDSFLVYWKGTTPID